MSPSLIIGFLSDERVHHITLTHFSPEKSVFCDLNWPKILHRKMLTHRRPRTGHTTHIYTLFFLRNITFSNISIFFFSTNFSIHSVNITVIQYRRKKNQFSFFSNRDNWVGSVSEPLDFPIHMHCFSPLFFSLISSNFYPKILCTFPSL